jgi:hypothetical protein
MIRWSSNSFFCPYLAKCEGMEIITSIQVSAYVSPERQEFWDPCP